MSLSKLRNLLASSGWGQVSFEEPGGYVYEDVDWPSGIIKVEIRKLSFWNHKSGN